MRAKIEHVFNNLKATRRLWLIPAMAVVLGLGFGFGFRGMLLASSAQTSPAQTSPVQTSSGQASSVQASSGNSVTMHGCVREKGRETVRDISVNAGASCPAGSTEIQWTGTEAAPGSSSSGSLGSSSAATPAAAPAGGNSAANARAGTACGTSSTTGGCASSYSGITGSTSFNTHVTGDVWNPVHGYSQSLSVQSPSHWSVTASAPSGNSAVVSYPDTQQLFNEPSISSFSSITSTFAQSGPGAGGGDDYEAAYDLWTDSGHPGTALGHDTLNEIMVWVANYGQRPSGTDVGNVTIDGVTYALWHSAARGHGHNCVSLVLPSNESSGTVNILAILQYLASHGLINSDRISQIDFGWEICSTGGVAKTFAVTGYSLAAS
jgi:hypothetical protein